MKKLLYLLVCSGIILASCNPKSSVKKESPDEPNMQAAEEPIPFPLINSDTAKEMIKKYQKTPPQADTNYREFPRLISFNPKTLRAIANGSKITSVKFVVAAYLGERSTMTPGLRNTMILQITREKEAGKKETEYYDLRKRIKPLVGSNDDSVCPLPDDCYTEEE